MYTICRGGQLLCPDCGGRLTDNRIKEGIVKMRNRALRNILLLVMVLAITVVMGSCAHRATSNPSKEPLETVSQSDTDEIRRLILAVHDEVTSMCDKKSLKTVLQSETDEICSLVLAVHDEVASMCDKVEQKIETENRELKREKERLQVELNGLRTIKAELSKRNGKLEKDNVKLQKELDRLRSTVELLAKDKAGLLEKNIGLTKGNDEFRREVGRLNSIISGLIGHGEER